MALMLKVNDLAKGLSLLPASLAASPACAAAAAAGAALAAAGSLAAAAAAAVGASTGLLAAAAAVAAAAGAAEGAAAAAVAAAAAGVPVLGVEPALPEAPLSCLDSLLSSFCENCLNSVTSGRSLQQPTAQVRCCDQERAQLSGAARKGGLQLRHFQAGETSAFLSPLPTAWPRTHGLTGCGLVCILYCRNSRRTSSVTPRGMPGFRLSASSLAASLEGAGPGARGRGTGDEQDALQACAPFE